MATTSGGIAGADLADRSETRVILLEEKSDAGGVAPAGLTNTDSHGFHPYDPAPPGIREGCPFIEHEPLQLPDRILVPKCVDGLLVPWAGSARHVGYQTIRTEPVFMALGEACGIAAMKADGSRTDGRTLDVKAVPREIEKRGGLILQEDTAMVPDNPRQ